MQTSQTGMRRFVELSTCDMRSSLHKNSELKEGDYVDVTLGPFMGRSGRVSRVIEGGKLVVVSGDDVLFLAPQDVVVWNPID